MLHNAFAYVTRKFSNRLLSSDYSPHGELEFGRLVDQGSYSQGSQETFKNITNSFSMQINRRVNQGTPRGSGNIKGEDIKKSPKTRPSSLMLNASMLSEI